MSKQVPAKVAFSIPAFCDAMSIGRSKVYCEIKAGRIRTLKVGARTIIPATELEAYMERLSSGRA